MAFWRGPFHWRSTVCAARQCPLLAMLGCHRLLEAREGDLMPTWAGLQSPAGGRPGKKPGRWAAPSHVTKEETEGWGSGVRCSGVHRCCKAWRDPSFRALPPAPARLILCECHRTQARWKDHSVFIIRFTKITLDQTPPLPGQQKNVFLLAFGNRSGAPPQACARSQSITRS